MAKTITTPYGPFNAARYTNLKRQHNAALKASQPQFNFEEDVGTQPILITFSKYLLERLARHFK